MRILKSLVFALEMDFDNFLTNLLLLLFSGVRQLVRHIELWYAMTKITNERLHRSLAQPQMEKRTHVYLSRDLFEWTRNWSLKWAFVLLSNFMLTRTSVTFSARNAKAGRKVSTISTKIGVSHASKFRLNINRRFALRISYSLTSVQRENGTTLYVNVYVHNTFCTKHDSPKYSCCHPDIFSYKFTN